MTTELENPISRSPKDEMLDIVSKVASLIDRAYGITSQLSQEVQLQVMDALKDAMLAIANKMQQTDNVEPCNHPLDPSIGCLQQWKIGTEHELLISYSPPCGGYRKTLFQNGMDFVSNNIMSGYEVKQLIEATKAAGAVKIDREIVMKKWAHMLEEYGWKESDIV